MCENILQPVRDHFGRVKITSGFRSVELCEAIGSSARSQHARAEAADFEVVGVDNAELFDWIKDNLHQSVDLEFYTPVSLTAVGSLLMVPDQQEHHSYTHTSEGKQNTTKLGSAKDIV